MIMMVKEDLARLLANGKRLDMSQQMASEVVNELTDILSDVFARGEELVIRGFGTFKVVERASRPAFNIHAGEKMILPSSLTVKFTPSKALKKRLNDGRD